VTRLIEIMARLRDPETGCPWDREQTFRTIAPYTIEEAYEVADAIERGDMAALKEELGDLLFQVVFYAQIDFHAIATEIADKMVRRHPHVFGEARIETAEAQTLAWEEHKAAERKRRAAAEKRRPSPLDGIPTALPALTRAEKLQKRAARVGFDWPEAAQVLDKIEADVAHRARLEDEIGDLFFALVNLARHLGVDPEQALRGTSLKFERRFRRIDELLEAQGRTLSEASLDEMEALWQQAKAEE
jgi:ATP diphosphatase